MDWKKGKKLLAGSLAAVLLGMASIPYLPANLLTAWGFHLIFSNTDHPGHPNLRGTVEGESHDSGFFCMNEGASAKSGYDYRREDKDVSYSEGTMAQKRLFWAYIGTFGSADRDSSLADKFGTPLKNDTWTGKNVAWSQGSDNGGSDWVETMAADGFMSLKNIPEGCMSPQDIFGLIDRYSTPETAMGLSSIMAGPGEVDAEKLYTMCGISDWETFCRYCTIESVTQDYTLNLEEKFIKLVNTGATPTVQGQPKKALIKVSYDPSLFRVLKVTGTLEYFKCSEAGSQELYRAKGHVEETTCEFYLTNAWGTSNPQAGEGGNLGEGGELSLQIYEHQETFESNYKVELEKRDYETGHPLEDSHWQVLEKFDAGQLSDDETGIMEEHMREDPTTWEEWLVFSDDLKTDTGGTLSYADTRWYDFDHKYCNGHPIPPEPEDSGDGGEEGGGDEGGDDGADEYEALMEAWQTAVDACAEEVDNSNGAFHHWECGSEEEPSEEEAFEESGCREARDQAYDQFIHLKYAYTFRETRPRDGYLLHGMVHPEDVPVEIITSAASEAEESYEWTSCSNGEIQVTGYVRNQMKDDDSEDEVNDDTEKNTDGRVVDGSGKNQDGLNQVDSGSHLYLTENYELSWFQRAVNSLCGFFGMPAYFVQEHDVTVKLTAEPPETAQNIQIIQVTPTKQGQAEATPSDSGYAVATGADAKLLAGYTAEELAEAEELEDAERYDGMELSYDLATNSDAERMPDTEKMPGKEEILHTGMQLSENMEQRGIYTYYSNRNTVETYGHSTSSDSSPAADRTVYQSGEEDEDDDESDSIIDLDAVILDSQPEVEPGPSDQTAHVFVVYDHRIPGQVHFEKKDLELAAGETEDYDAHGDSQGDGTLEGAVYGLFAADPVYGPDTQRDEQGNVTAGTGLLFDTNDLVAVAATDREGQGSFVSITEMPHSFYDPETGSIQYSGKPYPENLFIQNGYEKVYSEEEQGRSYIDLKGANGCSWIGRPLIMGSYYIKELNRSEGYELSVTGKLEVHTNLQENPQGYGQGADTISNPAGEAWITSPLAPSVTFAGNNETFGNHENLLTLETAYRDAEDGYNVVWQGLPEAAEFYANDIDTKPVEIQIPDGGIWTDAREAPYYLTVSGSAVMKRDQDGNYIENPQAVKNTPQSYTGIASRVKKIQKDAQAEPESPNRYVAEFQDEKSNILYIKYELEQMLRTLGIDTPRDSTTGNYSTDTVPVYDGKRTSGDTTVYGMPEIVLEIDQVSTNRSLIETVLDYYMQEQIYTYGSLQEVKTDGEKVFVTIAAGLSPKKNLLYDVDDAGNVSDVYLLRLNEKYGRYLLRHYTRDEVYVTRIASLVKITVYPDYEVDDEGVPQDCMTYGSDLEHYLHYEDGETLYDYWYETAAGTWVGHEPLKRQVYEPHYRNETVIQENFKTSQVVKVSSPDQVADPVGSTYVFYDHEAGQHMLHVGSDALARGTSGTGSFTVVLPDGTETLTQEDIGKIGKNNVWEYTEGQSVEMSSYLVRIAGAGAGVYTSAYSWGTDSYIQRRNLVYRGAYDRLEDGGTDQNPDQVLERAVKQKVRVVKNIDTTEEGLYEGNTGDIHSDWYTRLFGGYMDGGVTAKKMDNFRFKIFLKSNLERLYRDESGQITWQDRQGREVNPYEFRNSYPELVQKLYTRVQHVSTPIYKDSQDAVMVHDLLYDFDGETGLIEEKQNSGYTRVLENYEKFFEAMDVANHDFWDEKNPQSTSYRPLGNRGNTSEEAKENTAASDRVRQFAIDWYLDEEVKKLVSPVKGSQAEQEPAAGNITYSDQIYDQALRQAIVKAENYLKPFFNYDLDEIYAIHWDSAIDGGSDGDTTTLSADTLEGDMDSASDGYYYGVSEYLPYGTYVTVECQPEFPGLGDFPNRHYETDTPKEISLPAIYEPGKELDEALDTHYTYEAEMTAEHTASQYGIRFAEESRSILAHNIDGDFEVYPYSLDMDELKNHVRVTQAEFDPLKDYYNERTGIFQQGENNEYYISGGMDGREAVSRYYRYSSIAEDLLEDTLADGQQYMQGELKAYDGAFAPMLVPWTVVDQDDAPGKEVFPYIGQIWEKFCNTFYTSKLRIEKLDSETKENILHDQAIFQIYAASREDDEYGEGKVLFYEEPTLITGSREFLEAMGAENITPLQRTAADGFLDNIQNLKMIHVLEKLGAFPGKSSETDTDEVNGRLGVGERCSGTVPAGTPVCKESEQILMTDHLGHQTGEFRSYTTKADLWMKSDDGTGTLEPASQNVGYVETPQPLGAGVYVLCEVKAPAGYVRCHPIAVEVYSDKITYDLNGNENQRIVAAVYGTGGETGIGGKHETDDDYETEKGENTGEETDRTARLYVENAPVKVEVHKIKNADQEITYLVSGRVEGTEFALSQRTDELELAYNQSGTYLGYGWKKGTLEYLKARKQAGEQVEICFENNIFTGFGYVTKIRETADDTNRFVAGATMTLFDAIEIQRSGRKEDDEYEGVVVKRNTTGNVTGLYVQEGYAGSKVDMVKSEDGQWSAQTIQRKDTPILHYDLDKLRVTIREADGKLYGYDRTGKKILVRNGISLYARKDGYPYLEFTGGDLEKLRFDAVNKRILKDEDIQIYHLDRDGHRDSLVDPCTGMAYLTQENSDLLMVWPVEIARDIKGNIIAMDKIKTSRLATSGEAETLRQGELESGFLDGSWEKESGRGESSKEKSHQEKTSLTSPSGHNMNDSVLEAQNPGTFSGEEKPVINEHGQPVYYQNSGEQYKKGTDLYDRDDDLVRYKNYDNLEEYNDASYQLQPHTDLEEPGSPLYHRLGEGYVLENTWVTGDRSVNDPFDTQETDGQADLLKRVPVGVYIMEELHAPAGYTKSMPQTVKVLEQADHQKTEMTDETIKVEISKVDGTIQYRTPILHMFQNQEKEQSYDVEGVSQELQSDYSYQHVAGAHLALYRAERVYISDYVEFPKGYYLKKADEQIFTWEATDSTVSHPHILRGEWWTDGNPIYLEGIPAGDYLLEELSAPEAQGYVKAAPLEIQVEDTDEVQSFVMADDHTKVEFSKYEVNEFGAKQPLDGAEFTLYRISEEQQNGECVSEKILKQEAELQKTELQKTELQETEIFDQKDIVASWITGTDTIKKGPAAEKQVTVEQTEEGHYRISHLPVGASYILVETGVPAGYEKADPVIIQVENTSQIQLWEVENVRQNLQISKVSAKGEKQLPGATLSLYRADAEGKLAEDQAHLVETWITGGDGTYTSEDFVHGRIPDGLEIGDLKLHTVNCVQPGIYYIVEKSAPGYYMTIKPMRVEVTGESIQQEIVIDTPVQGHIQILKKAADGANQGKPLSGAVFELTAYSQKPEKTEILRQTVAVNKEGTADIRNLPVGDVETDGTITPYLYTIKEVKAPEGYQLSEHVESFVFTPDKAGTSYGQGDQAIYMYVAENQEIKTCLSKTDITTGEEIPGALLQIQKTDGTVVEEWYSTDTPHEISGTLIQGETYILHEEAAPGGYGYAEDVVFTIDEQGTVQKVEMKDKPTQIEISKIDITDGKELPGATLQIKELSGEVIKEWVTGDRPYIVEGELLADHTYILHEEKAAEGYAYAADIEFKVSHDGSIDRVVMVDEPLPEETTEAETTPEETTEVETAPDIPKKPHSSGGNSGGGRVPSQPTAKETVASTQTVKTGEITATYDSIFDLKAALKGWRTHIPKVGDSTPYMLLGAVLLLSTCGAGFILYRRKKLDREH